MKDIIDKKAEEVRNAIISHKSFNPNWEINILRNNSVITLTGSVSSKEDVILIESIASDLEGVESVINELSIDESLQNKAADDLNANTDYQQVQIISQER